MESIFHNASVIIRRMESSHSKHNKCYIFCINFCKSETDASMWNQVSLNASKASILVYVFLIFVRKSLRAKSQELCFSNCEFQLYVGGSRFVRRCQSTDIGSPALDWSCNLVISLFSALFFNLWLPADFLLAIYLYTRLIRGTDIGMACICIMRKWCKTDAGNHFSNG